MLEDPCWRCGRDQARCKRKIKFASYQEADEWVKEFNESHEYKKGVTRYHCIWCNGWHMRKPGGRYKKTQIRRIEKMRRKWMIERRNAMLDST